jgi:hypothetical protein
MTTTFKIRMQSLCNGSRKYYRIPFLARVKKSDYPWSPLNSCARKVVLKEGGEEGGQSGGPAGLNLTV